jgi:hypothetical protein
MRRTSVTFKLALLGAVLWASVALADEAPISGTITAIDPAAQTLTLEATARGKTRTVIVHLKPSSRIVRFARGTGPGTGGFVEQPAALADLKLGWIVSVTTRHAGDHEIAELVTVVFER